MAGVAFTPSGRENESIYNSQFESVRILDRNSQQNSETGEFQYKGDKVKRRIPTQANQINAIEEYSKRSALFTSRPTHYRYLIGTFGT